MIRAWKYFFNRNSKGFRWMYGIFAICTAGGGINNPYWYIAPTLAIAIWLFLVPYWIYKNEARQ